MNIFVNIFKQVYLVLINRFLQETPFSRIFIYLVPQILEEAIHAPCDGCIRVSMAKREQARVQGLLYKRCTKYVFLNCDQKLSKVSVKDLIFQ